MSRQKLLCLVLTSIFLILFFPVAKSQTLPENPTDGFRVFIDKECVRCHAIWGEGEKVGPDLGKVSLKGSFLDLAGYVWNQFPYMQQRMGSLRLEWPKFTSDELSSLVAFLYTLQFFDVTGNPDSGRVLFNEKGCMNCHSYEGKGGKKGPDLSEFKQDLSPILMVQAMWNHVPEMSSLLQTGGSAWPSFQNNQLMDLLAFIRQKAKNTEREVSFLPLGSPEQGWMLFRERGCSNCHGSGPKSIAPDLKRNSKKYYTSMTKIGAILWNSAPMMWKKGEVPKFSGQELADIISYLYFLDYTDRVGDSKKGGKVYSDKRCSDCHSTKGPAIDFSQLKGKDDAVELATQMLNHAPVMQKTVEEKKIPWPMFNPGELRDLFRFIGLKKK
ncbi:MAG TPA: c-type cytochrome [Terriglobales bacterium]|nr:c-type cytochrome [Terriglobales bacterium]